MQTGRVVEAGSFAELAAGNGLFSPHDSAASPLSGPTALTPNDMKSLRSPAQKLRKCSKLISCQSVKTRGPVAQVDRAAVS
jgi:hypothetical protein